jgi:DNA integrity scanning protein DisA with diadenylate cyclase activity
VTEALLSWWGDSPFAAATWVDAVDIGLLAWLIYRVVLLIRGTRAMQSLAGLALLAGIYLLADALGLATLHWVLDNLFVYLVLALLILFQEDIRRALARAGGSVLYRREGPADANLLEEVVQAGWGPVVLGLIQWIVMIVVCLALMRLLGV